MASTVVSSDGTAIAYDALGEGPPVVLVHGFGANRAITWKNTGWYQTLGKAGFKVIAVDCRGHGESGKPYETGAYDEGRMAKDVVSVLDALAVPQADIIGYSMGAHIAIRLMHDAPSRLRGVVLGGQGATYFHPASGQPQAIAQGLLAPDPSTIADPIAREFRLFCEKAGGDLQALAACMLRPRRVYAPLELQALAHRVLVVCGEDDHMTGSPEPLASAFRNGTWLAIPKRNHHSTVGDKPFKDAAIAFFSSSIP